MRGSTLYFKDKQLFDCCVAIRDMLVSRLRPRGIIYSARFTGFPNVLVENLSGFSVTADIWSLSDYLLYGNTDAGVDEATRVDNRIVREWCAYAYTTGELAL